MTAVTKILVIVFGTGTMSVLQGFSFVGQMNESMNGVLGHDSAL